MSKVIGLTGSISVGKSTVTQYLRTQGYQVVDADEISRHALDVGNSCYEEVVRLFGCVRSDGTIDRQKLGQMIFHDSKKKEKLESIIHPYVVLQMKEAIEKCCDKLIFLDVPLLFEAHLENLCDKVIVVYINEKLQMERLMKRNHINQEQAMHLIHQQISIEKKKTMGDYVIDNSGNLENLYCNIETVLKGICNEIIHE